MPNDYWLLIIVIYQNLALKDNWLFNTGLEHFGRRYKCTVTCGWLDFLPGSSSSRQMRHMGGGRRTFKRAGRFSSLVTKNCERNALAASLSPTRSIWASVLPLAKEGEDLTIEIIFIPPSTPISRHQSTVVPLYNRKGKTWQQMSRFCQQMRCIWTRMASEADG